MFKVNVQDMIDNSVDYTLVTMCGEMIRHFCEETEPTQVLDCLIVSYKIFKIQNFPIIKCF